MADDLEPSSREPRDAGRRDGRRPAVICGLVAGKRSFLGLPQRERERAASLAVDEEVGARVPGQPRDRRRDPFVDVSYPLLQRIL